MPEALHNPVGEISIQTHARGQSYWVVRKQPHECRSERCSKAGRHENGALIHSRIRKDLRIDENDISHGHEGRDARHDLRAYGGSVPLQLEIALQHWLLSSPTRVAAGTLYFSVV